MSASPKGLQQRGDLLAIVPRPVLMGWGTVVVDAARSLRPSLAVGSAEGWFPAWPGRIAP